MESKQERIKRRNKDIRTSFEKKTKAQKKWTVDAVIESIATDFYLSVRTINAVIAYEGIYK
ncbi:hypothetical protein SGQ83_12620 [Flavobacterium sp. Fl-318]|jgi:hypothetical protein|uniref:Uncharacterized protein n=1 Tax=Flavobacterium cupriresistens TaxID=2893885 RepID=A0ABU4RC94_9FLAO|nr:MULTISPECIES: hypothetical protein [unclassified Flavobacterium]MDX6190197.1 hypothetical protein [Flavobacterium sp. Fl-318]UFH43015.1 hypothetical protein LNP23_02070 [Flavobacterium sp. F-323]